MNKQMELLSIRKGKFFNRKQDGQNQVGTTALFWTASKAILIPNRQVTSLSPSWHNKENYPFFSVLAQSSKFKLNCFYRSGFWFFPLWWQDQVRPSKCQRESGSILLCPLHNTAQQVQCRWHKRYRFHPRVRKTPLAEGMATPSSVLAWRIPWTEEPGGLRSMGSQRIRHDRSLYRHLSAWYTCFKSLSLQKASQIHKKFYYKILWILAGR